MGGFKKILDSFKGAAFVATVIVIGVLVGLNKITYEQFTELLKWLFGFVVSSHAVEKGAEHVGAGLGKGKGTAPTINVSAPKLEADAPAES